MRIPCYFGGDWEEASISAITFATGTIRSDHLVDRAAFSRLDILRDFDAVAAPWSALAETAPGAPYQTFAWSRAWCETVGYASQAEALLVLAYDGQGVPTALLPLVRTRRAGLTVASLIGGKDANGSFGLFARPDQWTVGELRRLLEQAADLEGIDLFSFRNQRRSCEGRSNPWSRLPNQASPSGLLVGSIVAEAQGHAAVALSKHARKLLRQKERRLAAVGTVEHRRAETDEQVAEMLSAYVAQKAQRTSQTGIRPPSDAQAAFLRTAGSAGAGRIVEWHALFCGDEIAATFAGVGHRGRFSGMVVAFDARPEFAVGSPGDVLIQKVISDLGRRGFTQFDLGIGEARYKHKFCDVPEPLFDIHLGHTPRGQIAARMFGTFGHAKGRIKQSTRLMALVARLRRLGASMLSRP